jgi:hypothetical protein
LRYERLERRYQRTATTITSAGNRNPRERGLGGSRGHLIEEYARHRRADLLRGSLDGLTGE